MRIAIIGASGWVGGAILREALARGHAVTAVGRDPVRLMDLPPSARATADIYDVPSVREAVAGHEAVVASVVDRQAGDTAVIPAAAKTLLRALPEVGIKRLVFVGGGGSLEPVPGSRIVDLPDFPAEYKPEALAQAEALEILRSSVGKVHWTYVSPPPVDFVSGDKIGSYRVQEGDAVLTDEEGRSRISSGDFASGIVDELEIPRFMGKRITLAY
jgi:putative NADH-flavin reductase